MPRSVNDGPYFSHQYSYFFITMAPTNRFVLDAVMMPKCLGLITWAYAPKVRHNTFIQVEQIESSILDMFENVIIVILPALFLHHCWKWISNNTVLGTGLFLQSYLSRWSKFSVRVHVCSSARCRYSRRRRTQQTLNNSEYCLKISEIWLVAQLITNGQICSEKFWLGLLKNSPKMISNCFH